MTVTVDDVQGEAVRRHGWRPRGWRPGGWRPRGWRPHGWPGASSSALGTWLVGTPLAAVVVRVVDANPLTSRGVLLPLAAGIVAIVLLAVGSQRTAGPAARDRLAGVAAGAAAVWVAFCLWCSYQGTAFGDGGVRGDIARMTAMITRFTETWRPVDAFVPSVPSEYPPLFPWIVGRMSLVLHRPGWALLGDAEALLMSLSILLGFLLWRRLTTPWLAVLLCVTPALAFARPAKVFEIFTLCVIVPWALSTLARHRQPGGLHWLPAGALLGVIVQTYQGFLVFGSAGLAVLVLRRWRDPGYLRHLVLVALTAFVLSAWYLIPYLYGTVTLHAPRVNDLYVAPDITGDPLYLGILAKAAGSGGPADAVMAWLELTGLVGLVVFRGRQWWAAPLLTLVAGSYAYRIVFLIVFVLTGHTGYLDYTTRLIATILSAAGLLTLWTALPAVSRRVRLPLPPGAVTLATAIFLTVALVSCWQVWMPLPAGLADPGANSTVRVTPNLVTYAHIEPYPDGRLPRYHLTGTVLSSGVGLLPAAAVEAAIDEHFGAGARPTVLSTGERLFAYVPYPAYMAVERQASNTFTHWDARYAEVLRIAAITDPDAFARATAGTRFGAIDVFLLNGGPNSKNWSWGLQRRASFTPASFGPARWEVRMLPNNHVLAMRR